MLKQYLKGSLYILFFLSAIVFNSCKTKEYANFNAYFNTFYNAERLMYESEDEFEFQREKKRVTPKIIAPMTNIPALDENDDLPPAFLSSIVVSKATRQAVEVKLDSILIKGSKILAKNAKSDYIEPTLYLMAKSYFYKEEWLPCQIKCSELIDLKPDGDYSPDAHLLMSFSLLLQKKYHAGKTMLSRTVDVAWLKQRYDILTKAFNMEAEMALLENDLEGAIRPYFQAIAQADDKQMKALWQCELANILFRMGKFERAKNAYAKVLTFSPDLVTEYESKLYYSSCLIRLGDTASAEKVLKRLDDDGKFTEWKDYVAVQRLHKVRLSHDTTGLAKLEKATDSLYPTSRAKTAYYFEKGIQKYKDKDYLEAKKYVALARSAPVPLSNISNRLFGFLNNWEMAHKNIELNKITFSSPEFTKGKNKSNDTIPEVDTNKSNNLDKKEQLNDNKNKPEQNINNSKNMDTIVSTKPISISSPSNPNAPNISINQPNITLNNNIQVNNLLDKKSNMAILNNNVVLNNNDNNVKSLSQNIKDLPTDEDTTQKKFNFIRPVNDANSVTAVEDINANSVSIQISDSAALLLEMANSYFSLARLHYNIGNIDSANYYYYLAATTAPLSLPGSARYLYVYSTSVRDTNEQMADSLLDVIVATQPKTEYGKAAMAQLGYTAAFVMDSVVSLYNSGFDLMKYNEFDFAINQFKELYDKYPANQEYAPKSLYSIGYIFERKLNQYDSAYYYYKKVVDEYPKSIYAAELTVPVRYLALINSGEPIPEDLQEKKLEYYKADYSILTAPIDSSLLSKPVKEEKGLLEKLKNPKKMLEDAKKSAKEKINKLKDIDLKEELKKKVDEEKEKLMPKLENFIPGAQDTTKSKSVEPEKKQLPNSP
ncbi:MAG: tetratricopeptide repeat protein [Bacteroidetes bacterium]|nr:tetratricopeptide repeat protein [Bacteroidota bacterium]